MTLHLFFIKHLLVLFIFGRQSAGFATSACFMCPLLHYSGVSHPYFFSQSKCSHSTACNSLTLFDLAFHFPISYGFQFHCPSWQLGCSPVDHWVESKEEWVSEYEIIFSQTGEIEPHAFHSPLMANFEPTVELDLPFAIFGPIYIVDSEQRRKLELSNVEPLLNSLIDEISSGPAVK